MLRNPNVYDILEDTNREVNQLITQMNKLRVAPQTLGKHELHQMKQTIGKYRGYTRRIGKYHPVFR